MGSVQKTKALLSSGEWDFDFVFFTESDQILVMRDADVFYDHLEHYPRRLVIPHRLMPYPEIIIKGSYYGRQKLQTNTSSVLASCCLKRQQCTDREDWVHVSDSKVAVVDMFGLYVPLGNTNFHQETYRACVFSELRVASCP